MKEDTQTTTSSQQTDPWAPMLPMLHRLGTSLAGLQTALTPDQKRAMDQLMGAAGNIPNFGGASNDAIRRMLRYDNSNEVGMLRDAYGNLQQNLGSTASGEQLDPYLTPGFADAISRMTGDVTDRVKGGYAASGRDPSGAGSFAGSLGGGLTEAIAPTIMAQYNQNKSNQMGAASTLYGAGASTAAGVDALRKSPAAMAAMGMGLIPQATAAALNPANVRLNAANQSWAQPLGNLTQLLQPTIAMASLGQQSHGTQTSTSPQSTFGNIMGGLMGGTGILSSMGAFGSGGWLTPFLSSAGGSMASALPMLALSDKRAKDDIEDIGELKDGQKVVRFTYKGENIPRMGLLAQDVAKKYPGAVHDVGGLLAVDYRMATDRAASMKEAA